MRVFLAASLALLLGACEDAGTCVGSLCGPRDVGPVDTSSAADAGPSDAGDAGVTEDAGLEGACRGSFRVTSQAELTALSACVSIEGELWIESLESVRAELPSLVRAGSIRFTARGPRELSFAALSTVDRRFDVDGSGLEQIDVSALSRLGSLRLANNRSLSSVTLGTLDAVEGLELVSNPSLTDLGFMSALQTVERLVVHDMDVVDLSAFSSLSPYDGTLELFDNERLESLDGLVFSPTVGRVELGDNSSLVRIDALSGLTETASLSVAGNTSLIDLSDLETLVRVGGTLQVDQNTSLTSLGLRDLRRVDENIVVRSNVSLPTCLAIDLILRVETQGQLGGSGTFSGNRNDCTCSGAVGTATATCP